MDKGGTSYAHMVDDDFPKDITVLSGKSEVQNKDFTRAITKDGIYNHHNVFMELSKSPGNIFGCTTGWARPGMPIAVFTAGATENGTGTLF
jgi:hypothetical protein